LECSQHIKKKVIRMNLEGTPLFIRTDASPQIGIGHVMRCLALAQAWQDAGGYAIFLMVMEAPTLEVRIRAEAMDIVHLPVLPGSVEDAEQTANLINRKGGTWVVVDGYHFGAEYQQIIKDSGLSLLFIDDNGHAEHYCADLILNQNIHACDGFYANREPYTRLLLGTKYVLLRREFMKWLGWKREIPAIAQKVLVTLGGGDLDNVTLKIIRAINKLNMEDREIRIVVGMSNPHMASLKEAADLLPFTFHFYNSEKDMPHLMAWADVAISAGGSTCWEMAFMGLPGLIIVLAENQLPIAQKLDAEGAFVNMGWHKSVRSEKIVMALETVMEDKEIRTQMCLRGLNLVNGAGGGRIVTSIMLCELNLRPVQEQDCQLIWKWANDPYARAASFSSEPIPWDNHVRWFKSKLIDPHCFFYIATNRNGMPVGQVRCDRNEDGTVISVSVDEKFRGSGVGSMIIELTSQKIFRTSDDQVIHAYIKQSNEASKRVFIKAGFRYVGIKTMYGHSACHYTLHRSKTV